jgi:hypothetical protein
LVVNSITANVGNIVGDLTVGGNISPASDVKIGGVRAGPGANISNTGLLTIDTAGLPLSFGDFTANVNILTMVNVDEDMILQTSGNAEIQLVGNVGFYKPNGGGVPEPEALFFFARDDGQLRIFVPVEDPLEGGVEIIGSASGNFITPGAPGTMLQLTGNPGVPVRMYMDGNAEYASFVGRRFNGNVAVPTQVLAGQDVLRINATAATDLNGGNVGNVSLAQIRMTALENQTATAQGSTITFIVTPIGSPANARVEIANVTVANGVTATKFTTAGTVIATGNITGGNISTTGIINATGNITGGNISTTGIINATGNITGGNILTGGVISATISVNDSLGNVRSIPQNSKNANYTLQATDNGQMINVTTGNVTVPAGVFTSPFGQTISVYNNQNASNAIVQGAGVTLRLAGTAATGNRTLARYGLSTIVCVAANTFVISGAGLT